ncbi:MAG TPA: hypothetical protein VM409_05595 [Chloroflexia bacterium]|nr:hypothetical protein [Chloroflexia bacterium]
MDNNTVKSRGITAFGISLLFGGIALMLSVAILGFGAQSAAANSVQGPVAQGTQPIPVVTGTTTVTAVATGTVVATGTARATDTVVATREATTTVGGTGTAVATGTAVSTGTVVSGTAVATGTSGATGTVVSGTAVATGTTIGLPTTVAFPTETSVSGGGGIGGGEATPTLVSVGMPRTGAPSGDSNGLMLTLLVLGMMMTTIGAVSLAARRQSYRR